jgi:hypothetical protein
MMEFKEALKKLESSDVYKKWRSDDFDSYLTHAFTMIDSSVKEEWQIGYYNVDNDAVTTFSISDSVSKNPEAEVFKDEKKILPLDKTKVKLTVKDALEKAEKIQKEKYSAHSPFKKVVILQNLDVGQVWNITYITNSFKTLNMKIDAETGEIKKDELIEFFRVER